jgi:hypothetical protein
MCSPLLLATWRSGWLAGAESALHCFGQLHHQTPKLARAVGDVAVRVAGGRQTRTFTVSLARDAPQNSQSDLIHTSQQLHAGRDARPALPARPACNAPRDPTAHPTHCNPVTSDNIQPYTTQVVTHGRLYLRGQFAMHRVAEETSRLWLACDFLGPPDAAGAGGLLHELQLKHALAERATKRGEPFRPHFNSVGSRGRRGTPEQQQQQRSSMLSAWRGHCMTLF